MTDSKDVDTINAWILKALWAICYYPYGSQQLRIQEARRMLNYFNYPSLHWPMEAKLPKGFKLDPDLFD